MQIGVFLPSFLFPDAGPDEPARLGTSRAEPRN